MSLLMVSLLVSIVGLSGIALVSADTDPSLFELSPAKQVMMGVEPEDVVCNGDRVLMLRTDGSALCIKPTSVDRFTAMGIASVVERDVLVDDDDVSVSQKAELIVSMTKFTDRFAELKEETRSVVDNAVALYAEHGQDALEMITDGSDTRQAGEMYPFVLEFDTLAVVAHGAHRDRVGETSMIVEAGKSIEQIKEDLDAGGEIWMMYTFAHPMHEKNQTKKSLLVLHDNYIFGSGFYLTDLEASMMVTMWTANSAAMLYAENGTDAFDIMNSDSTKDYDKGDRHAFVVDADTMLLVAHGMDPKRVGDRSASLTDSNKSFEQIQLEFKTNNGTWVTYVHLDADSGDEKLKLLWLTPRDNYVFGAGFYPTEYQAKKIKAMMSTDNALAMYAASGEDAFAEITALNVDDGSYPFVLDVETAEKLADGSILDQRGQIAWKQYELQAAVGDVMETLQGGQGDWITYVFLNPDTGINQAKKAWVTLHGDYLFGSGFYLDGEWAMIVDVEWSVKTSMAMYEQMGAEDTFARITAMESSMPTYPFISNLELELVAHGSNPDLVGEALWDLIEPDKSMEQIRDELDVDGTSWIEYIFVNPATERVELKRALLEVYDDYVFGAGYYTEISVEFTEEEVAWLADNPIIRVSFDPAWVPYEYVDETGKLSGLPVYYIDVFEIITDSEFVQVETPSWTAALEHMQSGTADLLMLLEKTDERSEYMDFTEPWYRMPINIISADSDPISPDDLQHYTVMTMRDYAVEAWLDSEMPEVDYVSVDTSLDAINALIDGTADVFLEPWPSAYYVASINGIENIYNAGSIGDEYVLGMGYAKGNDVFGSILQKMIDAVPAPVPKMAR